MITQSDADCLLFRRNYMDYHADRFTDFSLMAIADGGVVGCFPASIEGKTVTSHGGLTFGGWQVADDCPEPMLETLSHLSAHYFKESGIDNIVVRQTPGIFSKSHTYYPPLKAHSTATELDGAAIDLRAPHSLGVKRRPRVKRATDSHNFSEASLEQFWPILEACLEDRHQAKPTHTLAEIVSLKLKLPDRIACFKAEYAGEIVAGAVVYLSRKVAHVQYMATNQRGRATHALDGLIFWLMRRYAGRAEWLSLGVSNERDGTLNQGLFDYKLSFGAKRVAHVTRRLALT